MIKEVTIENYKSIQSLTLPLGRVTVLIGENGCGKSNILEAIALGSAAAADKLDNEFLAPRGIRVTEPKLMRSAFNINNLDKEIKISFSLKTYELEKTITKNYTLTNENNFYSKWKCISIPNDPIFNHPEDYEEEMKVYINALEKKIESFKLENQDQKKINSLNDYGFRSFLRVSPDKLKTQEQIDNAQSFYLSYLKRLTTIDDFRDQIVIIQELISRNFLIFSTELTELKEFSKDGQIEPLGIKGQGLFKYLQYLSQPKFKEKLNEIKEKLELIDWFEDFNIPDNLYPGERTLKIKDRYLDPDLEYFDQKSANEGFLFLLFYFCLFIGEETPKFFAIDNIDSSLNPRLCRRLIEELVELAKKHDKQVILTTHNPAVLDGLDLHDDEQKLYVISRKRSGQTKANRIFPPKPLEGQEPVRLSEAFLRGYIGGLPKSF